VLREMFGIDLDQESGIRILKPEARHPKPD